VFPEENCECYFHPSIGGKGIISGQKTVLTPTPVLVIARFLQLSSLVATHLFSHVLRSRVTSGRFKDVSNEVSSASATEILEHVSDMEYDVFSKYDRLYARHFCLRH
jgi:hypothetical protein